MAELSEEQFDRARTLWLEGRSLGEIAQEIGCSVYDLSPWLWRGHALASSDQRATPDKPETEER